MNAVSDTRYAATSSAPFDPPSKVPNPRMSSG